MKNFSLSFLIDYIFTRTLIFIAVFVWSRYLLEGLTLAIILSISVTLFISVLCELLMRKKRRLKREQKQRAMLAKDAIDQFVYNDLDFCLNHLESILSKKFEVARLEKSIMLTDKQIMIFAHFNGQKLTYSDLAEYVASSRKHSPTRLLILCGDGFSLPVLNQSKQIDGLTINLLDADEIYQFLKLFDGLPKKEIKINKNKLNKLMELRTIFFHRKRARSYLFLALIVLFSSYFVRYSLYYLIFASFLLLLSSFCFLLNAEKINTEKIEEILSIN